MLLRHACTKAEFEQMIGQTGFRTVEIREAPIGLNVLLENVRRFKAGHIVRANAAAAEAQVFQLMERF